MYKTEKAAYYGEKYDGIFDDIPWEYAEMYEEMDIILHRYCSLQWNHREDLKAYALMFRNVDIDNCSIVDKAFFLNKANEIIGYKDKTYSANASVKEKLVRYYLEYDFLFEMYYKNQLEEEMTTKVQNDHFKFTIDAYNKLKAKQFDNIYSIINLTDQRCSRLISNIHELETAVINDNYHINVIQRYNNFEDFVREIALPYIFGMHPRQRYVVYEECFVDYAKKYCRNDKLNDLLPQQYNHIREIYVQLTQDAYCGHYSNPTIKALEQKKMDLGAPSRELYKIKNDFSTTMLDSREMPPFVFDVILLGESDEERAERREYIRSKKEQREKEIERIRREKEKERDRMISQLEKQIQQNQPLIDEISKKISQIRTQKGKEYRTEYDEFVTNISKSWLNEPSNVWKYMFEHQESLHSFISNYVKTKYVNYKQIRSGDSFYMQMKLSRKRSVVGFVTFMSSTQLKERFDKELKRELDISSKENICFRDGWAERWLHYIKPILADEEEREKKLREEEERKRREAEEKRLEQYRFNIRNRHWRDRNVSFREADHVYIVDGTPLDSVTTFVKNCFPEFDSELHAKRKAEALGITKEAVLEMWDKKGRESREQGTLMHKKIESFYLGKEPSTDETFELFKIFANKITLKPYRTEWAVYDWEQKIAGTIDFVDYQNGEYIIYDWKRSDKLIAKNGLPIKDSQYGEKALPPIENLDDSPYYHYALQLSLYKYILEKNYGITVSKLRLGIFHPSYNKPYVLEMLYLQNEIDTLFGLRSEVIF